MNVSEYLNQWAYSYKNDVINNIMPFWIKNGLDRKNGGVYTCLDRDGSLMDTTKSVWFQGRFGFIAAYAYNNIEKNPEWLAASKSCIDFIEAHCFDTDGHMFLRLQPKVLHCANDATSFLRDLPQLPWQNMHWLQAKRSMQKEL